MRKSYKVKSNIDLDILEKYGYKKENDDYVKEIDGNWWNIIVVSGEFRHITNFMEEVGYWTFDEPNEEDIQDLINAGIVEEDTYEE